MTFPYASSPIFDMQESTDHYPEKESATSDFPVDLLTLFREDWIDLEMTLVEPSGTITSPQTVVDVSSISMKVATS